MTELILGIDDAGRGPVIGPMVLAGCLADKSFEGELKKMGVKDSKELTHKRREFLVDKIKDIVETFEITISHPNDIDGSLNGGTNLNVLEAIKTAEIINKINKGFKKITVVVDCPSVSIGKWRELVRQRVKNLSNLEIVCEHKADKNHVIVSAASILAKSVREKEMNKLKEIYGTEIGSGYPSDPLTCRFLDKYAREHEDKGIFRKTWSTWKKACEKIIQRTLV